jgi:LuxR family maltose regulon positive regulatory protein
MGKMATALLKTKLRAPPGRSERVLRERLIDRLSAGVQGRLTLVSAPAGFGKTTLVTEWVQRAGRSFTWLSLDEHDNDPARFLTYLVAALQEIDPGIGQAVQAMLQAPQPPAPEPLLTALANDVAATSHAFLLVLDDYHLIHTPLVHQQLAFLLAHQPSQMHLVIITREDPPLPLARLRARGHMAEIRQADLQFTVEEADEFLRQVMGIAISPSEVAALHGRTEGWIAGLQLAGLSLRGHDDVERFVESFTGSHRYILDYLIEEVFWQQPPDVQDFLLRTSILDRLTASLCAAVSGRDDSREVLLALEQANLFIVPLDSSRQWYRYHRLFADLLRQQFRIAGLADVAACLHERASEWYEAEGFPDDAVQHALAASDWERAADLIPRFGDALMMRGEIVTLLGWLRSMPEEEVRARPGLCLAQSWALILTGEPGAAQSYLGEAEGSVQDDPDLLSGIIAAQAYAARARGDDERTIELSERALSLLPETDANSRSVVAVNLGIAYWSGGRLEDAQRALTVAREAAHRSGNHYAGLTALSFLGVILAARGRLHEGADLLRQAIGLGEGSPAVALAYNDLGALLYEWNDLEAAGECLQRGIGLGQRSGNVEILSGGYRTLARLRQVQGDGSGALDAVRHVHRLAAEGPASPFSRSRGAACHLQIALAQDDLAMAMRWAECVTEEADASPFYPHLGLAQARLLLAQNETAAAAEHLQAAYARAAGAGWQFGMVETRLLQALSAPTPGSGLALLADALALAQPEGYVRTFLDKGQPMVGLLRQAATHGIAPDYTARLLTAFEAEVPAVSDAVRPRLTGQPLIEPLSERELAVLQLLVEGRTYHEIAQALFVSVNTIKTHLKNVYGKLGVHSRRAAAAKAEDLGLIA